MHLFKNVTGIFIVVFFSISSMAWAEFTGPGEVGSFDTVAKANEAPDDTVVAIEGFIVKQLTQETYTFQDDTGQISIEIDQEDMPVQKITPKTKLKIYGEIDTEMMTRQISVERMEILTP